MEIIQAADRDGASLTVGLVARSRCALSADGTSALPAARGACYLHLLNPQSRQKSHPLACSNCPEHSGHLPIIVDMIAPVTCVVFAPCCLPRALAESGVAFQAPVGDHDAFGHRLFGRGQQAFVEPDGVRAGDFVQAVADFGGVESAAQHLGSQQCRHRR